MENEKWLPMSERVDEMVRLGVEISQLEEDLRYADSPRVKGLIRAELSRVRVEMYRLKAMSEVRPAAPRKASGKYRSSTKFHMITFGLLVLSLMAGSFLIGAIVATVMVVNFFMTDPPDRTEPAYAGGTSVSKE